MKNMNIAALTDKQLKTLHDKLAAELRARTASSNFNRTLSRLVAVDPGYQTATARRRFAGGFYTESFPSGHTRGFYAKTKSGILYKYRPLSGQWYKFEG